MSYAYVIYDGNDRSFLGLVGVDKLGWVKDHNKAWRFAQSWEAEEARDGYGFFGCEIRLVEIAPVEMTEAERWPRRPDWPLVSSVEELRSAVIAATSWRLGVRIPVISLPATLAFEPGGWLWVSDWSLCGAWDDPRGEVGVTATMLCGYFPYKLLPTEWHVEFAIEFEGVPRYLIPDSFKRREAA